MGRILRKKTPQQKKKNIEEGTAAKPNAQIAAEQTVPAVTSDNEQGKKQVALQKKPVPAVKPSQGGTVRNFVEKALQFLREVKVELKKVTWPSRKQAMGSTLVVIILVMIISLFLGVVDISLSSLIQFVF